MAAATDELHSTQQATSRAQGEQQSVVQQLLDVKGQLLAEAERRECEARQHEEAKLASEQQIAKLSEEAQLRTISLSTTQNALALARTQLGELRAEIIASKEAQANERQRYLSLDASKALVEERVKTLQHEHSKEILTMQSELESLQGRLTAAEAAGATYAAAAEVNARR